MERHQSEPRTNGFPELSSIEHTGRHSSGKSIGGLLAQLQTRGIRLYVQDGRLRCQAPSGALDTELREALQTHKSALLELLQQSPAKQSTQPIPRVERDGRLPASFAQQRLWFLQQLDPDSPVYNRPASIRMTGKLDRVALQRAMDEILRRHESLRTVFVEDDGEPYQQILSLTSVPVTVEDLSSTGVQLLEVLQAATREPFDLTKGPLVRVRLYVVKRNAAGEPIEHVLLAVIHHIVFDGWSVGVLIDELAVLYRAFHNGESSPIPELPVQYADYAAWQRQQLQGPLLDEQLDYWVNQLGSDLPNLDLPTDRPRPALQSFRGATLPFSLPTEQIEALKALGRRVEVQTFGIWLALLQTLLYRLSGQREFVVGTVIANRRRPELEGLIGFFVNTLALRASVHGRLPFVTLLEQVQASLLGAYAHQDLPFEVLVEHLNHPRDPSRNPLFQVAVVLHNAPISELRLPGLLVEPLTVDIGATQFDLTLHLTETANGLHGSWEYNPDLFDAATIERYSNCFLRLIESLLSAPSSLIAELRLLSEAQLPLRSGNSTTWLETGPDTGNLAKRFAAQALANGQNVALSDSAETLTYSELDRRANRLAHWLRHHGAGLETRVGLCLPRSLDLYVGMLAILKCGAAYVPLDPDYPTERLRLLVEDAGIALVVTSETCRSRLPEQDYFAVLLDSDATQIAEQPETEPHWSIPSDAVAYVIYTSGTTGKPKGVEVTHRNVLRLFASTHAQFGFGPRDVWSLFHSYAFDFSVWEVWGAWLYGGRGVVVSRDVARAPEDFYELLIREGVTVLNQTPASFYQLAGIDASRSWEEQGLVLNWVIFGGEKLEPQRLRDWFGRHGETRPRLVNMYGITETTVHVTLQVLEAAAAEQTSSPIGRPLDDLHVLVLDRDGQQVPVGVPGELYVGGAGLARGYLKRPGLTAERFVPHPFSEEFAGQRLYRTGDRVRYRADGKLEYLGRVDQQLKIRGFRIEPGEIEAQLQNLPAVRQAVVVAHDDGQDEKRLVAFVVLQAEHGDSDALRASLRQVLPDYMIPGQFVVLDSLPLDPHGKVNRRALPLPGKPISHRPYLAAETELECLIADVWQEVLQHERISVEDNFFELGGHSLMATKVTARLRAALEMDLPVRLVFSYPTVRELAEQIELQLIDSLQAEESATADQQQAL